MAVSIEYSASFLSLLKTLPYNEKKLIGDFVTSLSQSGYEKLPGRNKQTTKVSKRCTNRVELIQFAIAHRLWHYHIGHREYDKSKRFGDWTSEFVVHYQRNHGNCARLVHYDRHPPMKMPKTEHVS